MDNKEKIFEKKVIKSASKAAGLKSTLSVGDKLYLTSFGKGNDAVLEQQIDTAADYAVSPISAEPSLTVTEAAEARVKFDSKRPNVKKTQLTADNPLHRTAGNPASTRRDILGLKDDLEQRFFGRTFDDTIHIQIIYNILDIEKILAVYATNISAALNHMTDEEPDKDFIGYMGTINTYDVFLNPSINPSLDTKKINNIDSNRALFESLLRNRRLGYFGFTYDPNLTADKKLPENEKDRKKIQKQIQKNEEEKKRIYHLLALAGQLRQWSFHGNSEGIRNPLWLYQLETSTDREFLLTLDHYFDDRFNDINKDFIKQNEVNLAKLEIVYGKKNFEKVAKRYYDFIVYKHYKNMGFSIKKLRETMFTFDGGEQITSPRMDSVRDKLYKLMDFCLYWFYMENPEKIDENVNILRAAVSEEEKEKFYTEEAGRLWEKFRRRFLDFCDHSRDKDFLKPKVNINQWESRVDVSKLSLQGDVSYFAKLLYAICFFLDGKEINDLLTTLINKFDNIRSFIATGKTLGLDVSFQSEYDFFNQDCARYVAELNLVKNIARMKKPDLSAKQTMYRDALHILGVSKDMTDEAFEEELNTMLDTDDGDTNFRNFICNNVIKSNRFIYVIKFCKAETVHKFAENTVLTEFVLRRMPETQINRYYQSCFGIKNPVDYSLDRKVEDLADMMKKMHFDAFKDVKQDTKSIKNKTETREERMRKERYKAMIGLYLSVVYQLVKNLVYVNSRYVMAFHALERDAELYGVALKSTISVKKAKETTFPDYTVLTRTLLKKGANSRSGHLCDNARITEGMNEKDKEKAKKKLEERQRRRELMTVNIQNATDHSIVNVNDPSMGVSLRTVSTYRNNIDHLTTVRSCTDFIGDIAKDDKDRVDSYFALYHYLTQRLLQSKDKRPAGAAEKVDDYYRLLDKHNSYVKDFVKALNSPFGYDYPRFKNLSIQQLFDRNELQPEPKED